MKKAILLLSCLALFSQSFANDALKQLGLNNNEIEYLTLSDGKYTEFHGYKDIEIVGSAIIDMKTKKIIGFVDRKKKSDGDKYELDMTTRFLTIDPMAEKYNEVSPYAYCANNPIMFIDPNGEDMIIYYEDENGESQTYTFTGTTDSNTPNNPFVSQVIEAWNYNVSNGGGDPSFEAATNSDITVNIVEYGFASISQEATVFWNPNAGREDANGSVVSPATVLDHELDHQVEFSKDPVGTRTRAMEKDSQYGTTEERRVITGSEQKTAKANGEIKEGQVTRTNHGGDAVITYGTTSNKINRNATYQFYLKYDKEGYNVDKQLKKYGTKK